MMYPGDGTIMVSRVKEQSARLFWLDSSGAVQTMKLSGCMLMGRRWEMSTAQIEIKSQFVSREHGVFTCSGGTTYYQDVGKTNGTWINGIHYTKDDLLRVELQDGDVLKIGTWMTPQNPENVVMIYTTRTDDSAAWTTVVPDRRMTAMQIGRSQSTSGGFQLAEQTISRQQCVFRRRMEGWTVENQSRTNPVQLNGKSVQGERLLQDHDVVRMGTRYAIYFRKQFLFLLDAADHRVDPEASGAKMPPTRAQPAASADALSIHIERRSIKSWNRQIDLLRDIRLTVNGGEMVLILGGSGAGKTTFLHAVMGYEPAEGSILLGGYNVYQNYDRMKYEIGYVPQEDLLRKSDFVEETLDNAAKMKLPPHTSPEVRQQKVDEVLKLFGLEPERKKLVSKLSGGQRKRLSIAVEYVGGPRLFFLDEPDSGLDGIMARSLMENLRFIADSGKIVMVITHGPDRAAELFDKVLVLAKSEQDGSGHLAFFGSPEEGKRFFGTDSLEGIVKKINRRDEGGDGMADEFIRRFQQCGRN